MGVWGRAIQAAFCKNGSRKTYPEIERRAKEVGKKKE